MIRDDGTLTFRQVISSIFIPASEFILASGTPALEVVDAIHHGLLLDSSSSETLSCPFIAPPYWNSVDITYYCYNATSGDGGVVLGYYMQDLVDGSSLSVETPTIVADVTITNDGSEDEDDLKIITGDTLIPVTAGGYNVLKIGRLPADAADTLAADFGLLGVLLTRGS